MILVIAEQQQGKLNRASWEAIAAAQQLAAGAMPITVAVAGGSNLAGVAGELAQAAVAEVLTIEHAALALHRIPAAGRLHPRPGDFGGNRGTGLARGDAP